MSLQCMTIIVDGDSTIPLSTAQNNLDYHAANWCYQIWACLQSLTPAPASRLLYPYRTSLPPSPTAMLRASAVTCATARRAVMGILDGRHWQDHGEQM